MSAVVLSRPQYYKSPEDDYLDVKNDWMFEISAYVTFMF